MLVQHEREELTMVMPFRAGGGLAGGSGARVVCLSSRSTLPPSRVWTALANRVRPARGGSRSSLRGRHGRVRRRRRIKVEEKSDGGGAAWAEGVQAMRRRATTSGRCLGSGRLGGMCRWKRGAAPADLLLKRTLVVGAHTSLPACVSRLTKTYVATPNYAHFNQPHIDHRGRCNGNAGFYRWYGCVCPNSTHSRRPSRANRERRASMHREEFR